MFSESVAKDDGTISLEIKERKHGTSRAIRSARSPDPERASTGAPQSSKVKLVVGNAGVRLMIRLSFSLKKISRVLLTCNERPGWNPLYP
jgi:hypothetical protein